MCECWVYPFLEGDLMSKAGLVTDIIDNIRLVLQAVN